MKLKELLPQLEEIINGRMDTFSMLGKQAKKIEAKIDELNIEVDTKYKEMKEIVAELKYVLPIVKEQNPDMVGLLEEFGNNE